MSAITTEQASCTPDNLLNLLTTRVPAVAERQNVSAALQYAKQFPEAASVHLQSLAQALDQANSLVLDNKVPPALQNLLALSPIIAAEPLPSLSQPLNAKGVGRLVRAGKRLNELLLAGELGIPLARRNLMVAGTDEPLTFHLKAAHPEALLAGGIYHGAELWLKQRPRYARVTPPETVINALCEVLGYYQRNTPTFVMFHNPRFGLNWYDPQWGFSKEFLDFLDRTETPAPEPRLLEPEALGTS